MRRLTFICVVILATATSIACEQVEAIVEVEPGDVAGEFVAAWNDEDFEAMWELFPDTAVREKWHPGALRVFFNKVLRSGRMTSFNVELAPVNVGLTPVSEEPATPQIEYTISYESSAAREPVEFQGRLPLEEAGDGWAVRWRRGLVWPGWAQAKSFHVEETTVKRGTILDRDGKKLAVGTDHDRTYPNGSVGGITLGHLEPAEPGSAALVGASGLEEAYDDLLKGRPKTSLSLWSRRRSLVDLGSKRGRPGHTLRATLDIDVQRAAQAAYGSTTGGAVVLDPRTGDILAAVSSSAFDPNNYVGVANIEPFDRALSGLYPPGSSLKVMTASAALDTGEMKPTTTLTGPKEYRGVRNFESGEFGTISFATALQYSVNTAFAQIALELGTKRLFDYSNRFGFNRPPEMELHAATSSFPKPLDEGDLMWGSIGQAQVLSTPLQMATVAGTVANDGKRMEPRIDLDARKSGERALQKKTALTMTELMRNVVIGGTGSAANVTGLEVAGKTGTAEVDVGGKRKNHAWFICFAPAPDPRVAVAVVSEYGGVGGEVAAPLARGILTSVWPHLPK